MVLAKEKELEEMLTELKTTKEHLPKIFQNDPAIIALEGAKIGDVVKVYRPSKVTGKEEPYWRLIVEH